MRTGLILNALNRTEACYSSLRSLSVALATQIPGVADCRSIQLFIWDEQLKVYCDGRWRTFPEDCYLAAVMDELAGCAAGWKYTLFARDMPLPCQRALCDVLAVDEAEYLLTIRLRPPPSLASLASSAAFAGAPRSEGMLVVRQQTVLLLNNHLLDARSIAKAAAKMTKILVDGVLRAYQMATSVEANTRLLAENLYVLNLIRSTSERSSSDVAQTFLKIDAALLQYRSLRLSAVLATDEVNRELVQVWHNPHCRGCKRIPIDDAAEGISRCLYAAEPQIVSMSQIANIESLPRRAPSKRLGASEFNLKAMLATPRTYRFPESSKSEASSLVTGPPGLSKVHQSCLEKKGCRLLVPVIGRDGVARVVLVIDRDHYSKRRRRRRRRGPRPVKAPESTPGSRDEMTTPETPSPKAPRSRDGPPVAIDVLPPPPESSRRLLHRSAPQAPLTFTSSSSCSSSVEESSPRARREDEVRLWPGAEQKLPSLDDADMTDVDVFQSPSLFRVLQETVRTIGLKMLPEIYDFVMKCLVTQNHRRRESAPSHCIIEYVYGAVPAGGGTTPESFNAQCASPASLANSDPLPKNRRASAPTLSPACLSGSRSCAHTVWSDNCIDYFAVPDDDFVAFFDYSICGHADWAATRRSVRHAFFKFILDSYRPSNPYHNKYHAVQVYHTSWHLAQALGAYFPNAFPLLIASIAHDVDHFGVTNNYLIATQDPLSILYNDLNVLEQHHCAFLFTALARKTDIDIFQQFDPKHRKELRKLIIEMILATDMAKHSSLMASLSQLANKTVDKYTPEDISVLGQILLHASDLSNQLTPFPYFLRWAGLCIKEFNRQVDMEVEHNVPITSFMNCRTDRAMIEMELGFLEFVVLPLWQPLCGIEPQLMDWLEQGRQNSQFWRTAIDIIEHDGGQGLATYNATSQSDTMDELDDIDARLFLTTWNPNEISLFELEKKWRHHSLPRTAFVPSRSAR